MPTDTQSQQVIQALQAQYGSADWNNWQTQRWQYYDYIRYPSAGTTSLSFFSIALGGTDPNSSLQKTMEETNVPVSRQFGQVYFFINQIRCDARWATYNRQPTGINNSTTTIYGLMTNAMSKFNELLQRGVMNVTIGQKQYYDIEQPFTNAPPGYGIQIYNFAATEVTPTTAPKPATWIQCSPDRDDVYDNVPTQMVEPNQTINISIDYPDTSPVFTTLVNSATPAINVGVILDGFIVRPVS